MVQESKKRKRKKLPSYYIIKIRKTSNEYWIS